MNSSSETTPPSGHKANKTGNRLELFIEQALKASGYIEFWNHRHQVFDNRELIGGKQFIKQALVGDTIYDTVRKCDFLIINRAKFPKDLIIECKWQQSNGSVDEKYPYLLFNIIKTAVPTVILIDGEGYRPAALEWLKSQVTDTNALRGAWNMMEFQKQVNNGFLG
jgi:hypothetical protein